MRMGPVPNRVPAAQFQKANVLRLFFHCAVKTADWSPDATYAAVLTPPLCMPAAKMLKLHACAKLFTPVFQEALNAALAPSIPQVATPAVRLSVATEDTASLEQLAAIKILKYSGMV
jgi:hypothetical protein